MTTTPADPTKKTLLRALLDCYGIRPVAPASSSRLQFDPADPANLSYVLNRSDAQELISNGAVQVNGEVVTLFSFVVLDSHSQSSSSAPVRIKLCRDKVAELRSRIRVWALNKPVNVDCNMLERDPCSLLHLLRRVPGMTAESTGDEENQQQHQHQQQQKLTAFPIGRLDKDSEGLLLLTNSGVLAERACHPDFDHEKTYLVQVHRKGALPNRFFELMRSGGLSWQDQGTKTALPCVVEPVVAADNEDGAKFKIVLTQGLNRQIRRMTEAAGRIILEEDHVKLSKEQSGYYVKVLRRLQFGPVSMSAVPGLDDNAPGSVAELVREVKDQFLNFAFTARQPRVAAAAAAVGVRRERKEDGPDDE